MTSMCSSECGKTSAHNVCTMYESCCASYLQQHTSALASDSLRTARHCDTKHVMSTHRMIRYPCQPFPWLLTEKCAIDPQLQEGAPAKSRRGVHPWLRQYAPVTMILAMLYHSSKQTHASCKHLRTPQGQNAHLSKVQLAATFQGALGWLQHRQVTPKCFEPTLCADPGLWHVRPLLGTSGSASIQRTCRLIETTVRFDHYDTLIACVVVVCVGGPTTCHVQPEPVQQY